ncbi:MAG TPA: dockerin type I domain-containing protein [Trueperaceae bacterium]|nr:dockerin type I domain-containing protein [Trueperaceae bacterium]
MSGARRPEGRRHRPGVLGPPRAACLLAVTALLSAPAALAQGQTATPAPSGSEGQQSAASTPPQTVAVDPTGGPASLPADVAAAIQAWTKAAPTLVNLSVDPASASSIGYAPPALLGPDTLSLDLRTPGQSGITVQVAPTAVKDHPMVLLHEVGVLLGLPEGSGDVMAYAVPPGGEPAAPSSADVQALQAQRTFAPEDLNHDGTVDFYDLVLFGQDFGTQGVNVPGDFNHDGRVDGQDLALLKKAYHFSPPSQTAPGTTPATPASGTNAAGASSGSQGTTSGGGSPAPGTTNGGP